MSESVAPDYGDAPNEFVVADNVELPWPSAQGDMAWEWRVVSLNDMFTGDLPALCVGERDMGPEEDLGGRRGADADARQTTVNAGTGGSKEMASLPGRGGGGGSESGRESPAGGGGVRVPNVPLAFATVEG